MGSNYVDGTADALTLLRARRRISRDRPLGICMRWFDGGGSQHARFAAFAIEDGSEVWIDIITGDRCSTPPPCAEVELSPSSTGALLSALEEATGETISVVHDPDDGRWMACVYDGDGFMLRAGGESRGAAVANALQRLAREVSDG